VTQTCGFCGGSGRMPGPKHDTYGWRPDYPDMVTCEYCGGSGACEDGGKLLLCTPAAAEPATGNEGNPSWA
jgi:hypothetical protein